MTTTKQQQMMIDGNAQTFNEMLARLEAKEAKKAARLAKKQARQLIPVVR